jgi:hypothetical protein
MTRIRIPMRLYCYVPPRHEPGCDAIGQAESGALRFGAPLEFYKMAPAVQSDSGDLPGKRRQTSESEQPIINNRHPSD